MIKRIIVVLTCSFSITGFTCSNAVPTDNAKFCDSFKIAATCYCSNSLPSYMCQDMNVLYKRMTDYFGNLPAACQYQQDYLHYTTKQDCIDNWTCYHDGGIDSRGRRCNETKLPC